MAFGRYHSTIQVKSTRTALPAPVAAPPSYDAYYSFPLTKNGYSGVATYTRRPSAAAPGTTALKAEEGLTGTLRQPHLKLPSSDEERISRLEAYDYDELGLDSVYLKSLDAEGRSLTFDFGLFVLINVYCPNDGSSDEDNSRFNYKMAFHRLLEARVRALIREGREVILLGDLNACAEVIDHCEGDIIVRRGVAQGFNNDSEEYFWIENDARRWLRDLLEGDKKCLIDVVREYHPERRGMFTCWNTKLSARASNYGTRIDYILVTPGLLPWIKAADIEPSIKGSDHCPVWIELHEEIPSPGVPNSTLKIRDLMSCSTPSQADAKDRHPPRLATRFWDEYSGKQRLLASFFSSSSAGKNNKIGADAMLTSNSLNAIPSDDKLEHDTAISRPKASSSLILSKPSSPPSSSNITPDLVKKRKTPPPPSFSSLVTVALSESPSIQPTPKKQKKMKGAKKPGQSKLSSFFITPSASTSRGGGEDNIEAKSRRTRRTIPTYDPAETGMDAIIDLTENDVDEEDNEDMRLAIQLSLSQTTSSSSSPSPLSNIPSTAASQEAWKSLLKPPEPPRCSVHNEVAKEFRVNKPGVNKGRSFWVCSRPVGPGYDKGRAERPREEVDTRWKCNFFVWSSDLGVKRTTSTSGK